MTWQIPQSVTQAATVANLGTADDVFVASGVTIASTGDHTIVGTGSDHEVLVKVAGQVEAVSRQRQTPEYLLKGRPPEACLSAESCGPLTGAPADVEKMRREAEELTRRSKEEAERRRRQAAQEADAAERRRREEEAKIEAIRREAEAIERRRREEEARAETIRRQAAEEDERRRRERETAMRAIPPPTSPSLSTPRNSATQPPAGCSTITCTARTPPPCC